jgi:hypothetical protein
MAEDDPSERFGINFSKILPLPLPIASEVVNPTLGLHNISDIWEVYAHPARKSVIPLEEPR